MQVWCDWQLTLCDPHLSALEVRFHDDALYKSMFTFTFTFTFYAVEYEGDIMQDVTLSDMF